MNKSVYNSLLSLAECEVYLFGGFIRDILLKRESADVDLKLIIKSKNKRKIRLKIIKSLLKMGLGLKFSLIPFGGLLIRIKEKNMDLVVYSHTSKSILKTNFSFSLFNQCKAS